MIHVFEELSDEQAGKLIKLIFDYVNDKNPIIDDQILKVSFAPIKAQLKRDLQEWLEKCERNKKNGEKGGRPPKPKKPSGFSGNRKNPNEPDNDNDTDNDTDNVNDNVNVDSHNEIFKRIWNSQAWIESRCIAWKCSVEDLKDHLHNFRRDCIDKGDLKDDESKAKSHFINWVNKGNPIQEKAHKVTKSNIKDNWW